MDALLKEVDAIEVEFSKDQRAMAFSAYQRLGKGKHKSALNFANCCSYALNKTLNTKLLYKGEDFSKTDLIR